MDRELVVFGSASQVPTRYRNHNGYLLRWDGQGTLFDPGEGTQRQMLFAGVPPSRVARICITHFHGDHCLGLPGVLQRLSLDAAAAPVTVVFPAAGTPYFERLRHASAFDERVELRPVAVDPPADGTPVAVVADASSSTTLFTARLDHRIPAVGWRVEEWPGRTMLADRLAVFGIAGPDVARLQREGSLATPGRVVRLEEVSIPRPAQSAAVVMDTAWCNGALRLAEGADLLVCEATFADAEAELAAVAGHLTAGQAGRLAAESGARRLVLTHFSQRYPDVSPLLEEARANFGGDVMAAADLGRIAVPPRLPPGPSRTPRPTPATPAGEGG